ncbi:nucleoside-diphosphate sugar epimerase/dehydratase [Mesonia sp.]|uniref:polysaccharide biosynthesis protein n=1 Tax=Mesonia sp. TaxID=1960830 RepID=UPI001756236B|nr:nucleoside-diphosphate sugar epimerase/dehydratase [Mesonia sp.]HIB38445.1 polysaccharide biosynthesis protein [Mesonia sp.]HIO26801.1 polysaccharide biosynthesis protein [Flavobacteriaceae bacterium]
MEKILQIKISIVRLGRRVVKNYVPRWIIFSIDLFLCLIAANTAYFFVSSLQPNGLSYNNLSPELFGILLVQSVYFFIFKSFIGLVRYSSFKDAIKQLQVTMSCVITVLLINRVDYYLFQHKLIVDAGIFIYGFIAYSLLFFFRISVKRVYEIINSSKQPLKKAYILGTSVSDVAMAEGLVSQNSGSFNVIGFININENKTRNRIFNLPIYDLEQIKNSTHYAKAVIVSDDRLQEIQSNSSKNLVSQLLELKIKIYKLPKLQDWDHSDFKNLKEIKIEDLLQRNPIKLNNNKLLSIYENKTILVTGAAGSIGSEIVRQLINFNPEKIILLDQAETPLHELKVELNKNYPDLLFNSVIANVRDKKRLDEVFKTYLPEVVFHGAAYKHVPMMEANPVESLSVNFKGTKNIADLSIKHQVERFVFVSTDKAVNPTNIMGATKRAAELYIQSLAYNLENNISFITTRFGNVLGSNGSVIPHFKKQIENNGPVTVTHPEITRFFMTIDEACQLVLEAGAMGKGGEIYVFDMGSPIKIIDLAHHMIRLTGLTPNVDIKIEFTGLRPGEKLYEELLADKELTLPTHHEKILIAKASHQFDKSKIELLTNLEENIKKNNESCALDNLKMLVPEYIPTKKKLIQNN